MSNYTRSITPDSFTGGIFALEGIRHSLVLINGPSGCKFFHSAISDNQSIHQTGFDPLAYPEEYFFGQPRVPCTYLDSHDYVYGSIEKLEAALPYLHQRVPFELIGIVNSPGAALIGDDIKGAAQRTIPGVPCLTVESPGFSLDATEGFDTTMVALLKMLDIKQSAHPQPGTVNILGLTIMHKYFKGDALELRRLLALCNIEVNCFLGAGCTLEEIQTMPQAVLNVVIHPEYAVQTAPYLEQQCKTPTLRFDGPPIGFAATESFVQAICEQLGIKPSGAFKEEAEKARAAAFAHIARVNSMTGLPKSVPFAVEDRLGDAQAYSSFLIRHFGMALDCISVVGQMSEAEQEQLQQFLALFGMQEAAERDILDTSAELVLASGSTIAALKQQGKLFCGIETSLPTLGYLDVLPKTHLGLQGALQLTEQVLNGLLF